MPRIVEKWQGSSHAKQNVDCYSCHKANDNDPSTFDHYGKKITVIVTPNYCGRCHAKEQQQFAQSHHAQAAQFMDRSTTCWARWFEGGPAAANGCRQCHGSEVEYVKDGKFDPDTWPNSGIGRVNRDSSKGSCAACHGRRSFSSALRANPRIVASAILVPTIPRSRSTTSRSMECSSGRTSPE
jgi:hypothetical protein